MVSRKLLPSLLVISGVVSMTTACGLFATRDAPGAAAEVATSPEVLAPEADRADYVFDSDVGRACGVLHTETFFATGSAALDIHDRPVLDYIAACLVRGPLVGRAIVITGHADPRGEPRVNLSLGARRAEAVRRYLIDRGVEPARVSTRSAGSSSATGTAELDWAVERHVELHLASE